MAGIEVDQFITSHRETLNEEKLRFQERTPRSILPSGSQAVENAARLRRERESEYKDFLKTQGKVPKSRSISEIRREMAQSREKELSSHSDTNLVSKRGQEFDYGGMKERRMAEERRYRNHDYLPTPRNDRPSVSFKENQSRPSFKEGSWESEEKDLVSWTRQQHNTRRSTRPPSPVTHISTRSISAPSVGGITALGGRESDLEAKRNRQKEYAESLRAQMRERERNSLMQKAPESTVKATSQRPMSPEPLRVSPHREPYREPYRSRSPPREHRDPPSMRDYPHYPPSLYHHYPHPPPPPHHYYPPSSYYHPPPPPPRDAYYLDRPDPYQYHPYYPPHEYSTPGSYLPPHVPSHVPSKPFDDWREARPLWKERVSEKRKSVEVRDNHEKKGDQAYTSPIHGDGSKVSKVDKNSYRRELEKQMKEKKERDLKAKIEREKYEQKKENEIYDPFGKGGCGAPVRDQHGNLVADLKKMKRLNDERTGMSPRSSMEYAKTGDSPVRKSIDGKASPPPQETTIFKYDKVDNDTHKRNDQESYRDYLRRQVKEKEERKRKQKEAEMLEEKKELERLERDRQKLENDLKGEQWRERLTEVELKHRDDVLKKEAENERRELAIRQREELHQKQIKEKQLAEQRMQELADKMAQPIQQQRSCSPPIPTLRKQLDQQEGGIPSQAPPTSPPIPTLQRQSAARQVEYPEPNRVQSPPVPTLQRKQAQTNSLASIQQTASQRTVVQQPAPSQQALPQSESRSVVEPPPQVHVAPPRVQNVSQQSAPRLAPNPHGRSVPPQIITTDDDQATESTILSQLAAMRMHLQAQLADQIKSKPSETQVQPPAVKHTTPAPRPTAGPRVRQPHSSGALAANMEKFSTLKYKSPFPNQEFLSQFPNPPRSESALEVQQGAMLRYQEERLARLRDRGKDKENKPSAMIGGLLPSKSQGVPLSSADPFYDELPSKPDLLSVNRNRTTRRKWSAGGQSQFSVSTLDVDGMANRNEERMRRLDTILNAGTSGSTRSVGIGYEPSGGVRGVSVGEDSETILSNFLSRDSHGRPSLTRGSERSLECETAYQRLGTPST